MEQPDRTRRFTLPSAYTILFALIVLIAIATWIIRTGVYKLDKEGASIPGTYHEVDSNPQRILIDSLIAPINGLYGIEDETGNINYYNAGVLFGAIDVALFIIVIGGFLAAPSATAPSPRLVLLLVGLAIGILFVLRHADRVRWDPGGVGGPRHERKTTRPASASRARAASRP